MTVVVIIIAIVVVAVTLIGTDIVMITITITITTAIVVVVVIIVIVCLGLRGHNGVRVSMTPLTPKLMRMPHNSAQNIDFAVAAADAAASVLYCIVMVCLWHAGCGSEGAGG